MKKTFFGRYAVTILVVVFFLLPFGLRGARMALQRMRNEVKDWLPSSFTETAEMEWFWKHFIGERFIVASWEGLTAEDDSYKLFLEKLKMEVPPSKRRQLAEDANANVIASGDAASSTELDESTQTEDIEDVIGVSGAHGHNLERPFDFIGDRLALHATDNVRLNWGGLQEKWLRGRENQWYYITPDGNLYFWKGGNTPLITALSGVWRNAFGGTISGELIATFDPEDGPWFYKNPKRLNAQLFKTVTSGPDAYADLTREGGVLQDNPREARRRLAGLLFGPDAKQTCFILTLTSVGLEDFHRVVGRGVLGRPQGRLYDLASECGVQPDELHMGGPPVDNVAIDEEGSITLINLVSISVVLGLGLAYACFRSIPATIIVFFVGGIGAVCSVAIVGWTGAGVDAVLMSMPSLVYVLGISGAVHLINYYHDALQHRGKIGAPEAAIAHGWKPAVLCSMTTALGLFSLCTSQITPIFKFGLFSGIAVLATVILLFTYLPAALEIWPQRPRRKPRPDDAEESWLEKLSGRFWHHVGSFIMRHHYVVAGLCLLVIAIVGYGVTRINTSVNLLKLFDPDAKILADYAWLEENIGKLVPMEVVVRFPTESLAPPADATNDEGEPVQPAPGQLRFLERMEIVDRVQRVIDEEFGPQGQDIAGRSVSAVTFAPQLPPPGIDTRTFTNRNVMNRRLEQHRNEFLTSEYLRLDTKDKGELWRISVRIGALQDVDYGTFVNELKGAVEPIIEAQRVREQVVQTIARQRGEESYVGATVGLIGVPSGALTDATEETTDAGDVESTGEESTAKKPNQSQIFTSSLYNLLLASRLNVEWHSKADAMPTDEELASILDGFDCVVLVSDDPRYNMTIVREHAKALLDGSKHVFVSTDDNRTEQKSNVHSKEIAAVYTGVVPIVYKAQRTLLHSLMNSTFWSFATITPLMMFVSRSFWAGLVAMLPNVLPVFIIFGGMGWLDIEVDIGSMMTASIALGVAVDDTIHYLTWFRRELGKTHDRKIAILKAYQHCATPTLQAALISGLGLSVFAFSTFTPTQRFGYLMLSILLCGVIAELIFFPALLASPLGRVFKPMGEEPQPEEAPEPPEPTVASRPHHRPNSPAVGPDGTGTAGVGRVKKKE